MPMELFDEIKNRYFHIVFRVLSQCKDGLAKKDIIKIIDEEEFQEKVIGKDFQTFEGLLLNDYEESENYNLVKEKNGLFYPVIEADKKTSVPVRFTNMEKAWLKNLLEEPSLGLILSGSTIDKLKGTLKNFQYPDISELVEITNKSILPELNQNQENFRILLKAIMEEKSIRYCNTDRNGNEYCDMHALPLRLEYSLKDGRFRVSLYSLDKARPVMANVFTMSNIEIVDNKSLTISRDEAIKLLRENRYAKEPIVLEVTDKRAAMERCFMSFSGMERSSRCIEEDKYEIKLNYYTFEEDEIIRKILALGPYVKVISPQRIAEEVIRRIRRAIELNGYAVIDKGVSNLIELKGKYNIAKVYTDKLEPEVISQVIELCNQDFCKDSKIAIMPDTHAGKGCVIGFTADLGDKVIPNIVGVDIGCGMLTVELGKMEMDLKELDQVVRKWVPSGMEVHEGRAVKFPKLQELHCFRDLKDTKRIERSIGTLGGGNHFIELDIDDDKNVYLVIHSGSRNLGKQVAEYYQNLAIDLCAGKEDYYIQRENIIAEYKKEGKRQLIQGALKKLKEKYEKLSPSYPRDLCFLTGAFRDKYLHDMNICQEYAVLNRETMANIILQKLLNKSLEDFSYFNTTHNYINFKDNIIRKGSISAYEGEKVLIPINMRDGSILAVGKGNPDWNYSAPHGAGRLMSRTKAKENLTLEEYKKSMEGIFTTSVNLSTLDEAPMAYKPMEEIINNVQDTVEILKVIKPIYNFKAGE
jgi:RNA-splicing ligase RtcB